MRITSSLLGFSFFSAGTSESALAGEAVWELANDSTDELALENMFLSFGSLLAFSKGLAGCEGFLNSDMAGDDDDDVDNFDLLSRLQILVSRLPHH